MSHRTYTGEQLVIEGENAPGDLPPSPRYVTERAVQLHLAVADAEATVATLKRLGEQGEGALSRILAAIPAAITASAERQIEEMIAARGLGIEPVEIQRDLDRVSYK